jgi:hypothetical protein
MRRQNVLVRLAIFLLRRFVAHAPGIVLWLLTLDVLVQEAMGAAEVRLSGLDWLGAATGLGMAAVMRTTDEIKDVAVDRAYFPDRPLVVGLVTVPEVYALTAGIVGLVVVLNLLWPLVWLEVLAGLVFLYLMARWYFAPALVSHNRLLAIASNCPAFFFLCLQQAQMPVRAHGLEGPGWVPAFVSLLAMWPMLSCEFARKTFLPHQEMAGYQSYSALMGLRAACWMGLALAGAHLVGLGVLVAVTEAASAWVLAGHAVLFSIYAGVTVRVVTGRPVGEQALAGAAGAYFVGGMSLIALHGWT